MARDGYTGVMTTTFAPVPARDYALADAVVTEAVKLYGPELGFATPHFESNPGYARGAWVGVPNFGL